VKAALVALGTLRVILAIYAVALLMLVASNAYHPLLLCSLAEFVAAHVLSHADPTLVAVALLALASALCIGILSILIRSVRYLAAKRLVSQ